MVLMFGKSSLIFLLLLFFVFVDTSHPSKFKSRKRNRYREEDSSSSSSDCCQRQRKINKKQYSSTITAEIIPNISSPGYEINEASFSEQSVEVNEQCAQKPYYDYNVLALIWPSEYCAQTDDCSQEWKQKWDYRTPLLKGYWPSSGEPYYYECFADSDSKGDPFCQEGAFGRKDESEDFLINKIPELKEKNQQWYPFPKNGYKQYYQEEWLKHGSCYLSNMIEDNPKIYQLNPEQFNRTIMIAYFESGIQKAKNLNLILTDRQQFFSKQEFAQKIGFDGKEDHFNLICGDDNEVDEFHICYNRTRIPGKETTIQCPDYDSCHKYKSFFIP